MNALLPLLLLACQDPSPQATAGGQRAIDVIELKNGDVLEGRITTEVDGYVEIELDAGATVGVSRAQVAAVRRGVRLQRIVAAALPAADAWFVLHDARGQSVGWLHSTVTPSAEGIVTVSEEFEFVQGRRRYQVTSLCTAGADGRPRTCYFRERVGDSTLATVRTFAGEALPQAERALEERIVEATCLGDRLRVLRVDGKGRHERELPWREDATFPLLARTLARCQQNVVGPVVMFDPAGEELVTRSCDGSRSRRVVLDGEAHTVAELAESSAGGDNREWVDAASGRTLRRELAGPALVAMPSNAASARVAVGVSSIQSAVLAEPGGSFGLWLPNPGWTPVPELPAGQIVLQFAAHGASISLSMLDYLEAGVAIDSAADAVANSFKLLHPGEAIAGRGPSRLRDREAVQLQLSGRGGAAPMRSTVDVVAHGGHFLVLVCRAPVASWPELAGDFDFVRRSIEFVAAALEPPQQGPLARPGKSGERAAPAPKVAAPVPVPRPQPEPNVRIPKQG